MPLLPILHLELNGPGAPADARRAARDFVAASATGAPAFSPLALDAALLVISELVTNAVRHTSGDCVLELRRTSDGGLDVDVSDTSSAEPRPRRPAQPGEGGWGWHLVNRLGTEVGVRHHGEQRGKTIHVHLCRSQTFSGDAGPLSRFLNRNEHVGISFAVRAGHPLAADGFPQTAPLDGSFARVARFPVRPVVRRMWSCQALRRPYLHKGAYCTEKVRLVGARLVPAPASRRIGGSGTARPMTATNG
ncbi:ATP-binding protein [Streptomyces sp. NPDC051109]|uniref:ATP-binding protein n=1 Tax=Streptomyces sp. NPDC051109 TaxID=3365642 RepID=UPI0037960430